MDNEDRGSRLLHLVETIAISPDDAIAVAEQFCSQSRIKYRNDSEWEHQLRAANRIIAKYSKYAMFTGGATGLPGVIPGLGTAIAIVGGATADSAVCMKLQVDMCMCLAAVFKYDVRSEDVRYLVFLIAATGSLQRVGTQGGATLGSKAGVRMLREYLKGATLQAVKQLFRRIGVTFTRKALEKAIPFGIGIVLGGGFNYGLTKYVGSQAREWFIIDSNLSEDNNSLVISDPRPVVR